MSAWGMWEGGSGTLRNVHATCWVPKVGSHWSLQPSTTLSDCRFDLCRRTSLRDAMVGCQLCSMALGGGGGVAPLQQTAGVAAHEYPSP